MGTLSDKQKTLIFRLAVERGLLIKRPGMKEDEYLHPLRSFIEVLTGKYSISKLTVREAMAVIDGLKPGVEAVPGRRSEAQANYIRVLAVKYGWVAEEGKTDKQQLDGWLNKKYGIKHLDWLSKEAASDAIEGLKKMIGRQQAG